MCDYWEDLNNCFTEAPSAFDDPAYYLLSRQRRLEPDAPALSNPELIALGGLGRSGAFNGPFDLDFTVRTIHQNAYREGKLRCV